MPANPMPAPSRRLATFIHAGEQTFPLAAKITAMPLGRVWTDLGELGDEAHRAIGVGSDLVAPTDSQYVPRMQP
jgi:hypothetical protein